MIKEYTCPTCGYINAVWLLRINTSHMTFCENCYNRFCSKHSRICSFKLNHKRREKH